MDFLRSQLIGGLALIVGIAGFLASDLVFTPWVLGLLAFGGLWMAVVVIHALLRPRVDEEQEPSSTVASDYVTARFLPRSRDNFIGMIDTDAPRAVEFEGKRDQVGCIVQKMGPTRPHRPRRRWRWQ